MLAGADEEGTWPLDRAGRLALSAHLRDQDDLHLGSATHPGGVVWSAVAACALERDGSVGDALSAAALGYELTVRLAEAAGAEHRVRWHVTATAGTVGAAGAAAALLDPSRGAVVDAVAHAVSVAGGSSHAMVERRGTRFVHRAHAASSGVACARAACAGVPASRGVVGSGRGAFGETTADDLGAGLLAVRPRTAIEETGFRLHAATGFAHAAIDAALALGRLNTAEVERVRATVSPPAALALASNRDPADDEEAWWSIEHAVAAALVSGDSRGPAAEVVALRRLVELEAGGPGWGAEVEVVFGDGSARAAGVDEPRGHAERPASDDDLLQKWRRLAGDDGSRFFRHLLDADDGDPLTPLLQDAFGGRDAEALLR